MCSKFQRAFLAFPLSHVKGIFGIYTLKCMFCYLKIYVEIHIHEKVCQNTSNVV